MTTRRDRPRVVGVLVLILALCVPVSACVGPGSRSSAPSADADGSTPAPTQTETVPVETGDSSVMPTQEAAASPKPGTQDPECYGANMFGDHIPYSVANLMTFATAAVVAQVKSVEPAVFNSPDGKKPRRIRAYAHDSNAAFIFTPVILQVDTAVAGDVKQGALRAMIDGGTVGCISLTVDWAPKLEKGQDYVFFFRPSPDAEGIKHPELPLVIAAWPVGADGSVKTELDGKMTIAELTASVTKAVPTP